MSQSQNSVPNGPSGEVPEPKNVYESVKPPTSVGEAPQAPFYTPYQVDGSPRPQLIRIDSRANLQPRLGFPNPLLRPSQRPPPPGGTPTPFIQRPPQRAPPPGQNIFPPNYPRSSVPPNVSPVPRQPINPGIGGVRSPIPFQRPPGVRPQGIFQQRSLPLGQRPLLNNYPTPRGYTLDLLDQNAPLQSADVPETHENKNATEKPSLASTVGRSFSVASDNEPKSMVLEDRRRSISSVGSTEEEKPIGGNSEVLNGKISRDYSRPESRTEMYMRKIEENDGGREKPVTSVSPSPTKVSLENLTPSSPVAGVHQTSKSPAHFVENSVGQRKDTLIEQQASPIRGKEENYHAAATPEKQQLGREFIKEENANVRYHTATTPPLEKPKSPREMIEENIPKSPRSTEQFDRQKSPTTQKSLKEESDRSKTPDLKISSKAKLKLFNTEGDNDSGVDESTQGNDLLSNGSPKKPSKTPTPRASVTPTSNRSFSRGAKSPNPKSPETPTTPGTAEKKKIPMNKVQVGATPSPNLKVVKSKIGSLQNAAHKPGGGNVKIESRKMDFSSTSSRITAKNDTYAPGGGDKKIQNKKLAWNASSKIGSLENTTHKPKGGDKKIESIKLEFKDRAKPKVGSKDNLKHVPGGGDVKSEPEQEEIKKDIETKKLEIKVQSKIGSMDNIKHKPGGGDKKIFDDKEYLRQTSAQSNDGSQHKKTRYEKYDLNSPEVNLISPTQQRVRILDEVQVLEFQCVESRPSSRLSRSGSGKPKRPSTPRPPWRY